MTVLRAATRLVAALGVFGVVAVATVGATSTPARAAPTHVAVAVDFGHGRVQVACAPSGGNGSAVLGSRFDVEYNQAGLVAIIDGVGSMTPPKDLYWSYWHSASGGSWSYASTGPATFHPGAGTVEGWAYNDGSTGPATSPNYTAICAGQDPAPAPTRAPTYPRVRQPSPTPPAQPGQPAGGRQPQHVVHSGTATTRNGGAAPSAPARDSNAPAAHRSTASVSSTTAASSQVSSPPATRPSARPAGARHDAAATSAVPALGTALALAAAASIGGTAFWRLRRHRQGW